MLPVSIFECFFLVAVSSGNLCQLRYFLSGLPEIAVFAWHFCVGILPDCRLRQSRFIQFQVADMTHLTLHG